MATFVGVACRAYVGPLDASNANRVDFGPVTAQAVEFTGFNDGGYQAFKPGLISCPFALTEFQDFATGVWDDQLGVAQLGTSYPLSVQPNTSGTETAGDPAYFTRGIITEYNPLSGEVGSAAMSPLTATSDTAVLRGVNLHPKTARTTTGTGTAVAKAGASATQRVYGALHVFAYSGFTNVVVKIQSDDAVGFPSATDRLTFTTVTGTTSEYASAAGNWATETHLRASWTVTGTGSITFAVLAAIQ